MRSLHWALLFTFGCSGNSADSINTGPSGADSGGAIDSGTPSNDGGQPADGGARDTGKPDGSTTAATRIYATLVSHNEQENNVDCKDVVNSNNKDEYLSNRSATVDFAKAIRDAGGAYDMQSEMTYLDQIKKWDTTTVMAATDGKNLVKYLNEFAPGQVAVDAHSHEKDGTGGFNYADVAKTLIDMGVPTSGIVGGHVANPASEEDWTRFRSPLKALRSDYQWTAQALWGAASGLHQQDQNASGVWRPKSANEYFVDDPNQTLPSIGTYELANDSFGSGLDMLMTKYKNGELEKGKMYTVTLMTKQCAYHRDASIKTSAVAAITKYKAEATSGILVWANLATVLQTWKSTYASQPVILKR